MMLDKTIDGDDGASPARTGTRLEELPAKFRSCSPGFLGDKYEILGVLGRGGMGTVLKVRHRVMDRVRAAKLLDLTYVLDVDKVVERFRREAILVSELSHPNILKVFDLDRASDGTPFMTMEYLEGEDFEALIAREGRVPYREAVSLLAGAADALDMVHGHGIVHRDLKPSNLFLTKNGSVKVLDFGISHVEDENARLTNVGEVVGTPMYIAPEQLEGGSVDARTDVYSMAALAYHMITGRTVFQARSIGELAAKIVGASPRRAGVYVPGLPSHVDEALARGLAKEPKDRFSTVRELVRALAGPDLDYMGSGVRRMLALEGFSTPTASVTRWRGRLRRKRWRIGIAAALMAIAAALGSLLLFGLSLAAGAQRPTAVTLAPAKIEGVASDEEWIGASLNHMLRAHLALAPSVSVGDSREGTDGSSSESDAGRDARTLVSRARFDAEGVEIWLRLVSVRRDRGDVSVTARAPGYEAAVEEATWRLVSMLDSQRGATDEKDDCPLARQLATALDVGLWERARRLATMLDKTPEAAPSIREVKRIECVHLDVESSCAKIDTTSEPKRDVGAPGTICTAGETFLQRLACIEESAREDDPHVAVHYMRRFMERDRAAGLLLMAAESAPMSASPKEFETWLARARARHGETSAMVARVELFCTMHQRNAMEALIWARRSPRAKMREGLALQLGGWLRAGVETAARGAVEEATRTKGAVGRSGADELIRPTLYPPLITGSGALARAWLDGARAAGPAGLELERARVLMEFVASGGGDLCELSRRETEPYSLESHYACGRWAALLEEATSRPARGETGRAARYLVAEAKMRLEDIEGAMTDFERVERDPATRISQPFTALMSLARIGGLEKDRGNERRAAAVYAELLAAWDGLDTPLEEHMDVRRRAASLEQQRLSATKPATTK